MLPDRSKRYAGVDGEIPRLHLATNWQLVLVALLVLGFLTVIFPRKALFERLYKQRYLDDLTLSYVQNLYRTDPKNADAALLLARTRAESLDGSQLEMVVTELAVSGDLRQRNEARAILFSKYQQRQSAGATASQLLQTRAQLTHLIETASNDMLPEDLLQLFADQAFALGLPELGVTYAKRLGNEHIAVSLKHYGDLALGAGQHELAARYYFLARLQASSIEESRDLFQSAVKTLMAANLYGKALRDAKTNLGDLSEDRGTLRFMSRTALAAGDPVVAAEYARKLVFR